LAKVRVQRLPALTPTAWAAQQLCPRLRSLDLGRQQRFFLDVEVKELGVRKQGGQAIESAQRLVGTVKMLI